MTRQKKEIIKKIEDLNTQWNAELELGCGFFSREIGQVFEPIINELQEQLAKLQHYNSVEEMLYDNRGFVMDSALPFN